MKLRLLLLLLFAFGVMPLFAQSNKLIRELEQRHSELQKQIAEQESLLTTTKKDVGSQLNGLATLTGQIKDRKKYIDTLTNEVNLVEKELHSLNRQLSVLERDLKDKKQKYEASVQYLQKNRSIEEKLMFIFSAENLAQTYRRLRYVREYATYQRLQGEDLKKKQHETDNKRQELQSVKDAKQKLLAEREAEKGKLEKQEKEKRTLVSALQKKQKNIQSELNKKRQQATQLNNRIDKLIAEEIERARKEAEAEARKEAKAKGKTTEKKTTTTAKSSTSGFTMSKADVALSSDFASNRGKLPMPITGSYIIVSHYGQYTVEGLRNVKLDNKGIDIQGQKGAQARAIFNGKVAAVFKLNGLFNVLVRHGAYISVYCNLSSVNVKQGDTVVTKQELGPIFSNVADGGRTVLHFQLRKEKDKLNPEPWLNR
ncbi:MAG: peptidoglycan DD-metalloendopeptidase family protein [Bacteroides sp.]|nr:peptidoglycan DD-metalloendopeptidase family protein [Bacteroides sp.]